jgi:signal transduction histidine kinase
MELEVVVKDFGKGISKEQVNEITKPLYRGRAAKEKNKTGFGLGLAITKKIVEAHNGQLLIQSKINEGSTFIIKLPKKDK